MQWWLSLNSSTRTGLCSWGDFYDAVVAAADLGELDWMKPLLLIYISGSPCPDFSSAGLGRGLDGSTGGLWLGDCKLGISLRPPVLVREMVTGILDIDNGEPLWEAVAMYLRAGYLVAWCRLGSRRSSRRRPRLQLRRRPKAGRQATDRRGKVPLGRLCVCQWVCRWSVVAWSILRALAFHPGVLCSAFFLFVGARSGLLRLSLASLRSSLLASESFQYAKWTVVVRCRDQGLGERAQTGNRGVRVATGFGL